MTTFKKGILILLSGFFLFVMSCGSTKDKAPAYTSSQNTSRQKLAQRILNHQNITLMRKQVSGRHDGASAWHNISAAARGYSAKRSSYGRAPGGYVKLDPAMLRGMLKLADAGYRYRVTSIAGGSHSRLSRHYVGTAVDVDMINGIRVRHRGCPHWSFRKKARSYGATEVKGPGDRGHTGHVHFAWPR